jgi:predicted SnoaL-like aldol condensation-catalyzing enzyme
MFTNVNIIEEYWDIIQQKKPPQKTKHVDA